MSLDFRNSNTLWASILVETLHRQGVQTAVVCPGSRSAPLAIAFAQHPAIAALPVLDERSASFFALGLARRSPQPVVLVCTSGTAGANFYPALIEAHESRVPLLVLTADRPPELRDCNAGQAIDQQKLYGHFPNWYHELALPEPQPSRLAYLRQTVRQACDRTRFPVPGPVHLNIPFRDPLVPSLQPQVAALAADFDGEEFFAQGGIAPNMAVPLGGAAVPLPLPAAGVILAGPACPPDPWRYCEAIAHLSKTFGFPVLAEGLSPLRNYASLNPYLISTYDLILRDRPLAKVLEPQVVIRIGDMPTSKELRQWLETVQPLQWVVDAGDRNLDPLHLRSVSIRLSVEQWAEQLERSPLLPQSDQDDASTDSISFSYLQRWQSAELRLRQWVDRQMETLDSLMEGKVAWLLSQWLPERTPLFIANSTPIRDVEWFWKPGDLQIQPHFNRGANGIDGTLSTALGMAHRNQPGVLLTGDLALLHDTNGFLLRQQFQGHLTIVLINNNGGGIFEILPIAQFDPPFEEFFATPQNIDFAQLCNTYGVDHEVIQSAEHLEKRLRQLPETGIRVLEVRCDRKANARWLRDLLKGN